MKNKNLYIISKSQFGYHTDYFKWCEYLKDKYNITYIGFDLGYKKIELNEINVIYISSSGKKIIRGIRFILLTILYLLLSRGAVLISYFEGCYFFKIIYPHKKMLLDIRTLSIHQNQIIRKKYDKKIKFSCSFFNYITIISKGVKDKLNIKNNNYSILPLGADIISTSKKSYNELKLLYVGTFDGRDIDKTIIGLSMFIKRNPEVNISYNIVGDGNYNTKKEYEQLAKTLGIEKNTKFWGRIPYDMLKPFFDNCNVGISFIPKTDWYNNQPPTKTYEYIMSGLYCLATSTSSNQEIVNPTNGILHEDDALSFCEAIEQLYLIKDTIKQNNTINKKDTWDNIVKNILIPIIDYKL